MIQKKQVLIVEDNELNRAMLSEILSGEYKVLEAENGQEALDILQKYGESVDLILLDVIMPVMDGYTFLDRKKEDPELALIPVIVMTQGDSEEDEVTALARGATDFVPKPYRPQVILHRVASIIKLRESAAIVNLFQYDRLTGLYSKEFFYQKVRDCLKKNPEQEFTIVATNIENFKLYNDSLGTAAGDELLKNVAQKMLEISGENAICGRLNADRFLCLQERKREQEDGCVLECGFDQINNVVMKYGIYEITDRSLPVEQMCDRAVLAVDSIKGQYHRHFALYDETLRGKLLREKAISDAMENALAEHQFIVYYQPKYSLIDECMAGAEALVRWIHPEWGFMSPGEFIPLFERNGFIPHLDRYIWEQVCIQLHKWKEMGQPMFPVSVNMSRADVYQPDLIGFLTDLTARYDIPTEYLHLEITESAYTKEPDQILSTVAELRRLGFVIEMDDFGSEYSSLNMLSQMEPDIVKLDMKFIQNEMSKPEEQSILKDIIKMAHRMHFSVVTEGVETRDQMKRLQAMECDYVQGYFFARPMPVAEFEELVKSQHSCGRIMPMRDMKNRRKRNRLLVVDEEASYRKAVAEHLRKEYQVMEFCDVDSALSQIKMCGGEGISAVAMSMTFPEKEIAGFLREMRQDPSFWHIPVLATVPSGEMMEELPMALETDDFICKCHPIQDLNKRIERLVDIAVFRKRESDLQDAACRDYLTGLLNRRGLHMAMDSLRKEDLPGAVCLFDLDDLKKVNDTCGHDKGDWLIQVFADLLRRYTRSEDIQCRYGGDEFVVILKHVRDEEIVIKKGQDICRAFQDYLEKEHFSSSCSGGIALCGVDERPSPLLIERADQALYCAKREKKGSCRLWEEGMKE